MISEKTNWIFILTSCTSPEDRHLYDVVFGVKILLQIGVESNDITFIIDGNNDEIVQKASPCISADTHIYKSSDVFSVLQSIEYKNCVIIITGHGSINGLDSNEKIKPFPFLDAIKKTTKLRKVLILFCQCYAGIFNYMPVKIEQKKKDGVTPEIIIIGATDLTESLSYSVNLLGIQWHANITLVAFFMWLKNPVDIDGDNKVTVMDAFKYITIITNQTCFEIERLQHLDIIQAREDYKKLLSRFHDTSKTSLSLSEILEKESLEKRFQITFVHQEPWILNAFPAMKIEFG